MFIKNLYQMCFYFTIFSFLLAFSVCYLNFDFCYIILIVVMATPIKLYNFWFCKINHRYNNFMEKNLTKNIETWTSGIILKL